MQTRVQDIVWVFVAVACVALTVGGLIWAVTDFSFVRLVTAVLPALVAAGAWPRTKWGAPPDGLREHQERRALARKG